MTKCAVPIERPTTVQMAVGIGGPLQRLRVRTTMACVWNDQSRSLLCTKHSPSSRPATLELSPVAAPSAIRQPIPRTSTRMNACQRVSRRGSSSRHATSARLAAAGLESAAIRWQMRGLAGDTVVLDMQPCMRRGQLSGCSRSMSVGGTVQYSMSILSFSVS